MNAIILAAGGGERMRSVTTAPKCLLPIAGSTFLERTIGVLKYAGIGKIWIVIGYEWQQIAEVAGPNCCYTLNPIWDKTNSIYSLSLGLWYAGIKDDLIVMNADVYFHVDDLKYLIESQSPVSLLISSDPWDEESTKVAIDGERITNIDQMLPEGVRAAGEFTGIAMISITALPEFNAYSAIAAGRSVNSKWIVALQESIDRGLEVEWKLAAWPWIEVDTPEDYARAKEICA
jgi:choline kinase